MAGKEEKKKKKNLEKAMREYKQWELDQKQFMDDFAIMEDYLDSLSKQLTGKSVNAEGSPMNSYMNMFSNPLMNTDKEKKDK